MSTPARLRSRILFVVCLAITVAASSDAVAKPLLIVSAETGGDVVLIDPVKAQVIERIKVGARPRGLALSRDRRHLFVALGGPPKSVVPAGKAGAPPAADQAAGLAIVDVTTRKLSKQVATAHGPFAVDVLPDGRTALVSNNETNEVLVIDIAGGSVKKKIPVGGEPQTVATRPDGKVVYVATRAANELAAIDAKTMNLLGRVDAGMRPQTVVFAPPHGDLMFVPSEGLPAITIVDAKKQASREYFVVQGLPKTPPAVMQAAVFSRDGKRLYVTTGGGRSVVIVDPAKKAAIGTIDVGGWFLRGIAISADGKKLYTANGASNDVAIIDVASKKVEARVPVPGAPWGIVLVP